MVSGPGRHRPPSAGTAASGGAATAGQCAGNSRALPESPVELRRGLEGCMGGRDSGPCPRHGEWTEQGRGLWAPQHRPCRDRNRGLARAMLSGFWPRVRLSRGAAVGAGSLHAETPRRCGRGAARTRRHRCCPGEELRATRARTDLRSGILLHSLAALEAELVMIKVIPV